MYSFAPIQSQYHAYGFYIYDTVYVFFNNLLTRNSTDYTLTRKTATIIIQFYFYFSAHLRPTYTIVKYA